MRKDPHIRRKEILHAAIILSLKVGYQSITQKEVALRAKTSKSLITRYFGSMRKLKKEVLKTAIHNNIRAIIIQGIGVNDPLTKTIRHHFTI
jgi:AcrR family transcriptional regulator